MGKTKNGGQRYREKKERLYLQDLGLCYWCNRMITYDEATVDHLLPRKYGGTDRIQNLALSCHACNHGRGAQIAEQRPGYYTAHEWHPKEDKRATRKDSIR